MSRAPGVPGTIDIRSAAILQEYVLMTNPCAPIPASGTGEARLKRRNYKAYLQDIKRKTFYDSAKSWITLGAATLIIATVMGIFHATYLLVPTVQRRYDIGIVLIVFVYVVAYMIFIKMTTPASLCIKLIGHRLTVTFGMVVFFLGVILDVFTDDEPDITWYISIIFMAIGASFAYTGSMTIVSDLFRVQLAKALAIVSLGTPLGILIFYIVTQFLHTHVSYRWTRLILGTIALMMAALAQTFGRPRKCANETAHPHDCNWEGKDKKIRECIKNGVGGESLPRSRPLKREDSCDELESKDGKSCLCVCVCDISLWSDWSFILWGFISMVAVMPYLIPYFFLIAYAFEMGAETSIAFICWMCFASIITRLALMQGDDFTFYSNRILFQVCLIVVGVLYIGLLWTETYGWFLVWGIAMGAMEGAISVVIPRITLLTIPRQWVISSWSCILWFHAFAIAVGPLLVVCMWWYARGYLEAFITIAIIQFIGAIFATLLPNEENELFEQADVISPNTVEMERVTTIGEQKITTRTQPTVLSYSSKFANSFRYTNRGNYQPSFGSGLLAKSFATTTTTQQTSLDKNYKCCCPICKRYGCIPGCTPCTPGGLVDKNCPSFTGDDPCASVSLNTYHTNGQQMATVSNPTEVNMIPQSSAGNQPTKSGSPAASQKAQYGLAEVSRPSISRFPGTVNTTEKSNANNSASASPQKNTSNGEHNKLKVKYLPLIKPAGMENKN